MPFQGEIMTCCVCGKQQRSNPRVKSQWRALEIDNETFYACPDEFPSDQANRDNFRIAYEGVIACAVQELIERQGGQGVTAIANYRNWRRKASTKQ